MTKKLRTKFSLVKRGNPNPFAKKSTIKKSNGQLLTKIKTREIQRNMFVLNVENKRNIVYLRMRSQIIKKKLT
jgi:hypothetical protein